MLFNTMLRKRKTKTTSDRTTAVGRMINDYLQGAAQIEDHVIHLLFSANRWEAV